MSGDSKWACLWIVNRRYASCPNFEREYSIERTANPDRDSVGWWAVSKSAQVYKLLRTVLFLQSLFSLWRTWKLVLRCIVSLDVTDDGDISDNQDVEYDSDVDVYIESERDAVLRYQLADAGSSSSDDGESSQDVQDCGEYSDDDDDQWSETIHGTE